MNKHDCALGKDYRLQHLLQTNMTVVKRCRSVHMIFNAARVLQFIKIRSFGPRLNSALGSQALIQAENTQTTTYCTMTRNYAQKHASDNTVTTQYLIKLQS